MAAPICNDDVYRTFPSLNPACGNNAPPHIYQTCRGKHPRSNPFTVCENCRDNGNVVCNAGPGPLTNMGTNVHIPSPDPAVPPIWSANELASGNLDAGRRFPIAPGWRTRMCLDCENIVQARHYFLATLVLRLPDDASMWQERPAAAAAALPARLMNSCTCRYQMEDNFPGTSQPPRYCRPHRREIWQKLLNRRNETDRWLRNAKKLPQTGNTVLAEVEEKRARVRNGTYRACPCGKEVSNALVPPAARVYFCMGCGGFETLQAPGPPTLPLGVPGNPALGLRRFERMYSRWERNLPRIGPVLSSRNGRI